MQILEHNFVEFVYFVAETYIYTYTFLLLSFSSYSLPFHKYFRYSIQQQQPVNTVKIHKFDEKSK